MWVPLERLNTGFMQLAYIHIIYYVQTSLYGYNYIKIHIIGFNSYIDDSRLTMHLCDS
jgi:hypothetical protein